MISANPSLPDLMHIYIDAGCRMPNTGCRMLDAGAGCRNTMSPTQKKEIPHETTAAAVYPNNTCLYIFDLL